MFLITWRVKFCQIWIKILEFIVTIAKDRIEKNLASKIRESFENWTRTFQDDEGVTTVLRTANTLGTTYT